MIVSASRRTDIPAFYMEWMLARLRAGFALVRNPMNPAQVRRVGLTPEEADCIVFWSKNPAPLLARMRTVPTSNRGCRRWKRGSTRSAPSPAGSEAGK